jgi:hypothetical protein
MNETYSYIYPDLIPLLQFHCQPEEYLELVTQSRLGLHSRKTYSKDYLNTLPNYILGRCPFCDQPSEQRVDTYSLLGFWRLLDNEFTRPYIGIHNFPVNPPCPHFVGILRLINLHNRVPSEVNDFSNSDGEVPYVTDWLLPEQVESYAVLHALPVCRIEDGQFVPRYTYFFLTYFSESPTQIFELEQANEYEWARRDKEYWGAPAGKLFPPQMSNREYDLPRWAKKGKLGYLSISAPDHQLIIASKVILPNKYRRIAGIRREYSWKEGVRKPSDSELAFERGCNFGCNLLVGLLTFGRGLR